MVNESKGKFFRRTVCDVVLVHKAHPLPEIVQLKAIENIDEATFTRTISAFLHRMGIEALLHGNVDAKDAEKTKKQILDLVEASVPAGGGGLARKKFPAHPVTKVPLSDDIPKVIIPAKDVTDPNTAVELYIQIGKDNIEDRVMADLLAEMMYEPLYDLVRTKDQFGYQVSCDSRWTNGVVGIYFKIVTSSKSADAATNRLEQFLREYRKDLAKMSNETFMAQLAGLAKQKLVPHHSLSDETNHLWSEIRDGRLDWQSDRNEVLALRNITRDMTLKAFDEWLYPGEESNGQKKNKRRIMVIEVISGDGGDGDSPSSEGRPQIDDPEKIGDYIDSMVNEYYKACKHQTWGKIY